MCSVQCGNLGEIMARPSKRSPQVEDEICRRLSEGETLRAICRDEGMPPWRSVYDWIAQDEGFAARFARAREVGADAIAEETLDILDAPPERTNTEHGDKVDSGYVAWQKNRAEQRLKLLAKWFPKKYGDKQEIDLNVNSALAERLARAKKRGSGVS